MIHLFHLAGYFRTRGITLWKCLLIAKGVQGDRRRWLHLSDESLINCLITCVCRAQHNRTLVRAKCYCNIHNNKEKLLLGASCVFGFPVWYTGISILLLLQFAFPLFTTEVPFMKAWENVHHELHTKCEHGLEPVLNEFIRALQNLLGAGRHHNTVSPKAFVHNKQPQTTCFWIQASYP